MDGIKTAELSITSLKITSEDPWLETWIDEHGYHVESSPQYLALQGDIKPLKDWMAFRDIDWRMRLLGLLYVYKSVKAAGQVNPIKVYRDRRINTGHKRAAALLALGKESILAEFVPDDYKL